MVEVKFIVMLVTGVILGVAGGVLYAMFPTIIKDQVKENIQLREGTETFETWRGLPIPALMKIYFFNVTNADDVVNKRAKPILQELGPYIYKEWRTKENITWHDDNSVSYRSRIVYIFDEEGSNGKESDQITVPNIPLLSLLHIAKQNNVEDKLSLVAQVPKETLYVTQRVDELLFKGKESELLKSLEQLAPFLPPGIALPDSTFGLMVGTNDTNEEAYRVYTGVDDSDKFSLIQSWRNMSVTQYWKNDTCNMVNGTDGMQFPPFVTKDTQLYTLVPDICRSAFLDYESEVEHEGIPNYRFTGTVELFANPSVNPDNGCFCMNDDGCPVTGLLEIGSCKFGAPIYVGGAQFLMAEPALREAVEGLEPNPEIHKIFLDVEPTTGIVMSAGRRVQVNIQMQTPTNDFLLKTFPSMPRLMHPIFWQDEGATIDKANADKFKDMLVKPVQIGTGISYGLIAVGILLTILAVGFLIARRTRLVTEKMMK